MNSNFEEAPIMNSGKSQYTLSQQTIDNDQQNQQSKNVKMFANFEDLPNYPENTDLNGIAGKVLECFQSNDWKNIFDALDNLRVFNKFYYSNINAIFMQFGTYISQHVESKKSQVTKNCLLLIKEIFYMQSVQPEVELHNQFTQVFVPILLKYSTSVNNEIKNTAQAALLQFQQNCYQKEDSILAACQGCFNNKVPQVQIYALKLLGSIIQLLDQRFTNLNEVTLQKIMKTLANKLGDTKKPEVIKEAIQVCCTIGKIIGDENYINLMQVTLSVQEQSYMQSQIMQDAAKKTKKKENRPSLAQFLKSSQKPKYNKDVELVMNDKQKNIAYNLEQQHMQQQQQQNMNMYQQNMQFGGQMNQHIQNIGNNNQQFNNNNSNSMGFNNNGFNNNNNNNNAYGFNSNSNGF